MRLKCHAWSEEPDETPAKKKSMDVKQVGRKPVSKVKEKDLQ